MFDELRRHFTDAQVIEVTLACGMFAVANRVQDSLRIPIEAESEVNKIKHSVSSADPGRIKAYLEMLVENWPCEFPGHPAGEGNASAIAPSVSDLSQAATSETRLPLLDPLTCTEQSERFMAAAGRLAGGLTNVARVFANNPYISKLWYPFPVALEHECMGSGLSFEVKILALLRTAHLRSAGYSIAHRTALGHAAKVENAKLAALDNPDCSRLPIYAAHEQVALRWAEQVAPNTAKRDEAVFGELKKHFGAAEIMELTGACAMANQAALMQNALRIPLEPAKVVAALNDTPRLAPLRIKRYLEDLLSDWPQTFPASTVLA